MGQAILPQGLLIQLTRRCPLECKHCYVTASPRERSTIRADLIERAISEYADIPGARKVLALTGGDPFVVPNLLESGVALGAAFGFSVHVNTSAFFATTCDAASKALGKVSGLTQLEISIDAEHQRFVPLERVANALEAARRLAISTQLAIQAEDVASEEIGRLRMRFPEATLYVQDFTPVGGRNERVDSHPHRMPRESTGGCGKVGSIFIDETGLVFPCCSAVVASRAHEPAVQEHFALGRLDEAPLAQILGRLNSLRLRSVRCMGPSALRKFVEDNSSSVFRSFCDECVHLATDGDLDGMESDEIGRLLEWAMQDS